MKIPGKMAKEVLLHSVKAPATCNYPFEKTEMPEGFRGRMEFDSEKCIGCRICMRDCPTAAVAINKVGEKLFEAEFQLDLCIYCEQCAESCPKDAIRATKEYELAALDRESHRITFHAKAKDIGDGDVTEAT